MVQTLTYFTDEENRILVNLALKLKLSKTDVIRKIIREYKFKKGKEEETSSE